MNKSIGIFDSGFGGLTILREIVKELPQYDYIYLGDTARNPYGTRSGDIVYDFTCQSLDFLFDKGCDLVILACNTASALALRKVQREYLPNKYPDKKVLGVIIPTVEEVVEGNKKIGIMSTSGTARSKAFTKEINSRNKDIEVFEQACPLLVPLIENAEFNEEILDSILKKYLQLFIDEKVDVVILGCTHYSIFYDAIRKRLPANIKILIEGEIVSQKLKTYLEKHGEIETLLSKGGKRIFYTTDLTDKFQNLGKVFFGADIDVKNIEI
jgi:glutamate racemase